MATLDELLQQHGLEQPSQTKTASATKPTTDEVNKVLEDLGFTGEDAVNAAQKDLSKTANDKGDTMSKGFTDAYEAIFGQPAAPATSEEAAPAADVEKVASAEEADQAQLFGELTGTYFNKMVEGFIEKVAGDLEAEAGHGHSPIPEHTSGSLTATLGQKADPHVAVNRKAGEPLHAMTGNSSPYSLKGALAKQILNRKVTSVAGDVGGYKE